MMAIGDVVRLVSGGPWMTVASIRGDGLIDCEWMLRNAADQVCRGTFEPEMLQRRRWWH